MAGMDPKEIEVTIELAQLELDEAERSVLAKDLEQMLEYFTQMNQVDVTGVEPTTHSLQRTLVAREDLVRSEVDRSALLDQAPELEGDFITIPNLL